MEGKQVRQELAYPLLYTIRRHHLCRVNSILLYSVERQRNGK